MTSYDARAIDLELDELMQALPAISLVGPRGVGKTATARRRVTATFALDDVEQVALLSADPVQVLRVTGPTLIDEWQRWPRSWDLVRRAVDDGAPPGRYLLTGSAAPLEVPAHSGAGRIVDLRMRPLSLAERDLEPATVSVAALLRGTRPAVGGESSLTLGDYAEEIVRSGFPGIRRLPGNARQLALGGYLSRVVERDFPEQGQPIRRPGTLRSWLKAYAAATAGTASYNAVLDAATAGETEKPAKTTTIAYRDVLARLWLLDPVPGWLPVDNSFTRLAQAPKHHLADPALAAHLLGTDEAALLAGRGPSTTRDLLLGALFESLVTMSVHTYAQAADVTVNHLRTRNGDHEVDLILERRDGGVLALEVKLTASPSERDLRHLVWLREKIGDRLLDAAVITTGTYAYRRQDGIAVIPAALLGP